MLSGVLRWLESDHCCAFFQVLVPFRVSAEVDKQRLFTVYRLPVLFYLLDVILPDDDNY